MKRTNRNNRKYDREWPAILGLFSCLVIIILFCTGFVRALEMAAW